MKRTPAVAASLAFAFGLLLPTLRDGAAVEEEVQTGTGVAVRVGQIQRATVRRWVVAYGTVEPEPASAGNPGAGARLAAPATGVVAEVLCSEGQRVEKGAVLFRIASPVADAAVEFARLAVERERELLPTGGTSKKALQEAEWQLATARAERALLRIEAPFAGVVTRVSARPGEAVDPSTVLGELEDPDRLVVTAGVPAAELDGLRAGQLVELSAGEAPLRATLSYVSPRVDARSGLAMIRVALPAGTGLRAGHFLRLRIAAEERVDRLTVPAESIVETEDGRSAIAIVEGDTARQRPVERGLRDGDVVEIEGSGLAAGMRVVTEGAYGLPEQTKIRVLP